MESTARTGRTTITHVTPTQVGTTANIIFDPASFPFAVRLVLQNVDVVPVFLAYDNPPTTTAYDVALNGGGVENDGIGSILIEEGTLDVPIWAIASAVNTTMAMTVFSR